MSVAYSLPFKELDDTEYTKLRKDLLRVKGSERQENFLRKVRHTDAFLEYVSSITTRGTVDAGLTCEPMTESEYKDPPADTEQALFVSWAALTPAVACRSTFWANATIEHVRAGRIQSTYLAANGGNLPGGAERIDFALDEHVPARTDACVRTILRRLGGLREVRGNRSVYVDCPFARAWWRERMVAQAAAGDPQTAVAVRAVLRTSQTYWEKLIDRIVFRNSTFGSDNIRSAFLRALARHLTAANPTSELMRSKGLQRLCRRATAYQGARELSILDDDELDALMDDVLAETQHAFSAA